VSATRAQSWWGVARVVVAVGFTVWIFSRSEVRAGLSDWTFASPLWLLGAVVCGGLSVGFMAWRWWVCLRACGCPIKFSQVWAMTLAGNAAGLFLLGALGGDAVRILLAQREHPTRRGALVASAVLDHACGLPIFAIIALGVVMKLGLDAGTAAAWGWVAVWALGGFIAGGLTFRAVAREWHDRVLRMLRDRLTAPGTWQAVAISVPVVLAHYGIFWCVAMAVPLAVPSAGLLGTIALADGVASLPISIAGLGVREKAFETLLAHAYHVPSAVAVRISLTGLAVLALWAAVGAILFSLNRSGKSVTPR
jgi:glycosyltransferase 2 family protein